MPYKIGLTGGIGSGKSTVARAFEALGVPVFSADAIGHRLSARGEPAYLEIVSAFGTAILDDAGELDRAALGDIVFADERQKKRLEQILHPLILQRMHEQADQETATYCILDIPLLVGTREVERVDRILVVDCKRSTRFERIRQRNGWRDEKIERVMQNQVSDASLVEAADDIVDNNGEIDAIAPQVAALHQKYLELAERSIQSQGG